MAFEPQLLRELIAARHRENWQQSRESSTGLKPGCERDRKRQAGPAMANQPRDDDRGPIGRPPSERY
jgi:hypothetical protein